jgi:hypothetical protein
MRIQESNLEGFPGGKERSGEVLSCSPNHLVEFDNDFSLEEGVAKVSARK